MKAFALVDCNNFFVSCERAFQPDLKKAPLIVLSNNDGCVVARSSEVKKLGIPMGAPLFTVAAKVKKENIKLRSSNYTLYQDLSNRVMESIKSLDLKYEVYSIDEAFIQVECSTSDQFKKLGERIKERVYRDTSIPVSVGIATSKTLAKAAVEVAKADPACGGVCNLAAIEEERIDNLLKDIDVGDVWGVGYRTVEKYRALSILNAKDLKYTNSKIISKISGISGYRMQLELKGISCITISFGSQKHKSIAFTRSFGKAITTFEQLKEAVLTYVEGASVKLRSEGGVAKSIYIFIRSGKYSDSNQFFSNGIELTLPYATSDTISFARLAVEGLNQIFKEGVKYKKAGVIFTKISSYSEKQLSLFEPSPVCVDTKLESSLIIDKINRKWGEGAVRLAGRGFSNDWKIKRENISQRFTTSWEELPNLYTY